MSLRNHWPGVLVNRTSSRVSGVYWKKPPHADAEPLGFAKNATMAMGIFPSLVSTTHSWVFARAMIFCMSAKESGPPKGWLWRAKMYLMLHAGYRGSSTYVGSLQVFLLVCSSSPSD